MPKREEIPAREEIPSTDNDRVSLSACEANKTRHYRTVSVSESTFVLHLQLSRSHLVSLVTAYNRAFRSLDLRGQSSFLSFFSRRARTFLSSRGKRRIRSIDRRHVDTFGFPVTVNRWRDCAERRRCPPRAKGMREGRCGRCERERRRDASAIVASLFYALSPL